MKPPGFFRGSVAVARKDLQLEWRTGETLASSLVFSLIVLVIFNFAFDLATVQRVGVDRIVPGVLWIVLAFAAVVAQARSFLLEQRRDSLSALFQAPIDRGALYLGKLLGNLAKMAALEVILLPLTALLFNYDLLSVLGPLVLIVIVHSLGLTELGTLFAAVAVRVGRGEALLATLLFPAATPIFISAIKCTGSLLAGNGLGPVKSWLVLTAGFDFMYLVLAMIVFEFVLED